MEKLDSPFPASWVKSKGFFIKRMNLRFFFLSPSWYASYSRFRGEHRSVCVETITTNKSPLHSCSSPKQILLPTFTALSSSRCTRVKVIRVEVSQNVVHARTTGWMTSTRPGKLRDFGLQPRRSNPRSRNLFWALVVKSTWFLNFGGQAKCKLVLVVDSWPSLVVFGVVIPLWVKKHE